MIFMLQQQHKYLMIDYQRMWPLQYGVSIRTDYSPENNYTIPRSQTQCWPVKLDLFQQVLITAAHTGFLRNQQQTVRAWLSQNPNGRNVLPVAYGPSLDIHLGAGGNKWCFHIADTSSFQLLSADVSYVIDPYQQYYFNLQNVENKDNSYYLKFTFAKDGSTIEL